MKKSVPIEAIITGALSITTVLVITILVCRSMIDKQTKNFRTEEVQHTTMVASLIIIAISTFANVIASAFTNGINHKESIVVKTIKRADSIIFSTFVSSFVAVGFAIGKWGLIVAAIVYLFSIFISSIIILAFTFSLPIISSSFFTPSALLSPSSYKKPVYNSTLLIISGLTLFVDFIILYGLPKLI